MSAEAGPRPSGPGRARGFGDRPIAATASLIGALRTSLALGAEDEAALRRAGPVLRGDVDGWVDAFYARLLQDPTASPLMVDDASVLRLKRSLGGWAHEVFHLPFDAAYESARAEIGRIHVRIGMPLHLMVTAMGGLRRDVTASVARRFEADPADARRIAVAVEKALDLELALMLSQYERRRLEIERDRSRAEDLARLARRFERIAADAVSAALCHAALARQADDLAEREARIERLEGVLRSLHAAVARISPPTGVEEPVGVARVAALVAAALAEVSVPARTDVAVRVDPPALEVRVRAGPVTRAIGEVLQNAVNHDPGGTVRFDAVAVDGGGVVLEVADGGPGWPAHVHSVSDVVAGRSGMGLSVVEDVLEGHGGAVELFRPAAGGAGVRMRFPSTVGGAVP